MRTTLFILVILILATICVIIGYTAYPLLNESKAVETSNPLKDYQLDVYQDSTVIFDGPRHVATLRFDSTQALDSLIMDDNQ